MADSYLHDLDPILIQFTDSIAIRWYGLAYILGFVLAYVVLLKLAKKNMTTVRAERLSDFITYTAMFGVLLGGRLGYLLFYDFSAFISNPLIFFQLQKGGMASHGGMLGMTLYAWFYSRKHRCSWTGLGDDLVLVAPIGLFFGRMANFINGELFGKPTQVAWAVRFPTEAQERRFSPPAGYDGPIPAPELLWGSSKDIVERASSHPELAEFLAHGIHPRHPSQIYEALLEGLVIFLILLFMRLKWPQLKKGVITGSFFILYAVFRIFCEIYRLPDEGQNLILGLSKGQFYSCFLILAGLAFLVAAARGWTGDPPPLDEKDKGKDKSPA